METLSVVWSWVDDNSWALVVCLLMLMLVSTVDGLGGGHVIRTIKAHRKGRNFGAYGKGQPKIRGIPVILSKEMGVEVAPIEMSQEELEFHAIAMGGYYSNYPVPRYSKENWTWADDQRELAAKLLQQSLGTQKWGAPSHMLVVGGDSDQAVRVIANSRAGKLVIDYQYLPAGKVVIQVSRINAVWLFRYTRYTCFVGTDYAES